MSGTNSLSRSYKERESWTTDPASLLQSGQPADELQGEHHIDPPQNGFIEWRHGFLDAKRLRQLRRKENSRLKKVERFNGTLRDEYLNQNMFVTVAETRCILEERRENSATVLTGLWGGKAPWFTVQSVNPQTKQEPLTCHWYHEWGRGTDKPASLW